MPLFQKLYRKKQSDNGKNKQEDYLTELLAYVLQYDSTFQNDFFEKTSIPNTKGLTIKVDTQKRYTVPDATNQAQPDIVIEGRENDTLKLLILIENKIGTGEGWRNVQTTDEDTENHLASQLDIYKRVLNKQKVDNKLETHLIYLTRNFEIPPSTGIIDFKHIYWHQIYYLLKNVDENPLSITYQFKQYLINLDMSNDNRFSSESIAMLSILSEISDLIRTMDTLLEIASKVAAQKLGIKFQKNQMDFLKAHSTYSNWSPDFWKWSQNLVTIHIGFSSESFSDQLPDFYLYLQFEEAYNPENKKIIIEDLKQNGWGTGDNHSIGKSYSLSELLRENGEHIVIVQKWLETAISELAVHKGLIFVK